MSATNQGSVLLVAVSQSKPPANLIINCSFTIIMHSAPFSITVIFGFVKGNTQIVYKYVRNKSTTYPIRSAVIAGTFLYLTGRYIYHKIYKWYYQLPPGPFSIIPFFGNTLRMIRNPKWHIHWAMYYGEAFTFYQRNRINIMINDALIAKQILSKTCAQDHDMFGTKKENRKYFNLFAADDNTPSVMEINGKQWTITRQSMHSKLVRVMNTKYVNDIMSDVILNDLEPQLKTIVSQSESKWFCRDDLSKLTFNIIFKANFEHNVAVENNPLCAQLAKDVDAAVEWNIAKRNVWLYLFPNLAPMIIPRSYLQPVYDTRMRISNILKALIKQIDLIE